jgi:hypothetical protein
VAAILKVVNDRLTGQAPQTSEREPYIPPPSFNVGKRNFSTCRDLMRSGFKRSGIYTLVDRHNASRAFRAYCDQKTAGGMYTLFMSFEISLLMSTGSCCLGGWMLAFKQFKFQSGSVTHDDSLFGNPIIAQEITTCSHGMYQVQCHF